MNPVEIAKTILEKDICKTEDRTSLASAFTGVVLISPTEESDVLLLYKGLNKFGNHTDTDFPKTCTNGLKVICLPKYKPDCEVTKETIGISIRKRSPTEPGTTEPGPTEPGTTEPGPTESGPTESGSAEPIPTEPGSAEPIPTEPGSAEPIPTEPGSAEPIPTEPGPTGIWSGKELEYVQVPKGLESWELKKLENTFSPSTGLKSGFRYTLETNSHELILHGHEKDDAVIGKVCDYECCYLEYLVDQNSRETKSNIKKLKNTESFQPINLCENSKLNDCFQLHQNTLNDLDENPPNSAIGPTARVKCTDMRPSQELPRLLDAAFEVMGNIINLSLQVNFGEELIKNDDLKKEVLEHFNNESNYCQSMSIEYPTSALKQLESFLNPESDQTLDAIQGAAAVVERAYVNHFPSENMTPENLPGEKEFELCLQRVQVAIDKMGFVPISAINVSDNQNYKDYYERKLRVFNIQLMQILLAVRIKSDRSGDIISKFIEGIFLDRQYAAIPPEERHFYPLYKELQKLCWVMGKLIITQEKKLNELFEQYKEGNMGSDWFGSLTSLVGQLLDQWKKFVVKKKVTTKGQSGDPSNFVNCKKLKKKLNLKDGTAEKIVERWFKEGPLAIMKVERLTTNASVRYYCWSGTLDNEDPFHSHNDTHIPLTMHGRGTVREDK